MWMTVWYAPMPDSHPHRVTNTKCRAYTVISPGEEHIVTQNMQRKRNKHTKKNYAPSWLYLQDYTRIHGQQNIKVCTFLYHKYMDRNPHSLAELPVWTTYLYILFATGWSEWLRGLRSRSAATRLLRLWVRIPQGAWMFVVSVCVVR
jgi:hypothetical protein